MEPGLQPKLVAVNVKGNVDFGFTCVAGANDAGNFTASIRMVPSGLTMTSEHVFWSAPED
jgi:hypothetical protein